MLLNYFDPWLPANTYQQKSGPGNSCHPPLPALSQVALGCQTYLSPARVYLSLVISRCMTVGLMTCYERTPNTIQTRYGDVSAKAFQCIFALPMLALWNQLWLEPLQWICKCLEAGNSKREVSQYTSLQEMTSLNRNNWELCIFINMPW